MTPYEKKSHGNILHNVYMMKQLVNHKYPQQLKMDEHNETLPRYPTEDEVKSYFNSDDWSAMTLYEKKSYRNILHNFYMMKNLGLNPTKPAFMSRKAQIIAQKRKSPKKHFSPSLKQIHVEREEKAEISTNLIGKVLLTTDSSPPAIDDKILFTEEQKALSIQLSIISAAVLSAFKELYISSDTEASSNCETSGITNQFTIEICKDEDKEGNGIKPSSVCLLSTSTDQFVTDSQDTVETDDYGFSDYDDLRDENKKDTKVYQRNNVLTENNGKVTLEDCSFSDNEKEHDEDKEGNCIKPSSVCLLSTSTDQFVTDRQDTVETDDYGFSDYDDLRDENKKDTKVYQSNNVLTENNGRVTLEDCSFSDNKKEHGKMCPNTLNMSQPPTKQDKEDVNTEGDVKLTDGGEKAGRRYPRRSVSAKNYAESEVSQDDDYIFCGGCDREYEGDCPEHEPHTYFADNYAPVTGDEGRAERTTPGIMQVAPSKIPGAGSGVWTIVGLPTHARMGPYQGDKCAEPDPLGYSWIIMKDKKVDHYVRASSTVNSNWMRFVNCARHESEQNLMAFQYKGNLYYRTVRKIPPKSELLVWYGKEYAEKLGITLKSFRDPNTSHLSSRVFSCDVCQKTYTSPLYLEKHRRACYRKEGAHVRVAPDSVPSVASLARLRDGRKVYCCPYCQYQTGHSVDIGRHLAVNSGVRRFVCDVCGKGFTRPDNLVSHKRIHSGAKPYNCDQCDYSCNQSKALKRHMTRHSGEKVYACTYSPCTYSTADSGNMARHLRSHTGEKPYQCTQCAFRTTQKHNLTSHMARVHKLSPPPATS